MLDISVIVFVTLAGVGTCDNHTVCLLLARPSGVPVILHFEVQQHEQVCVIAHRDKQKNSLLWNQTALHQG